MSDKNKIENEILRLRRENESLKRRLAFFDGGERRPSDFGREFAERRRASENTSYGGYLKSRLGASTAVVIYRRIYGAIRKFLFASSLFRVFSFIFALVNSSAVFFIIFSALAILFPALFFFSLLGAFLTLLSRKRCEKRLLGTLSGKVYVVFGGARGRFREELMEKGTLLCVHSSFFACGFSSAVETSRRCYNIHISFVFTLMKKLDADKNISVVKIF